MHFCTFFLRSYLIFLRSSSLFYYFSFFNFYFSSFASLFSSFTLCSYLFYFYFFNNSFYSPFAISFCFYYTGKYLLRNGFDKIDYIEGLFFWFVWSSCNSKVFKSLEYWLGIAGNDPFKIFKAKTGKEFASNGNL